MKTCIKNYIKLCLRKKSRCQHGIDIHSKFYTSKKSIQNIIVYSIQPFLTHQIVPPLSTECSQVQRSFYCLLSWDIILANTTIKHPHFVTPSRLFLSYPSLTACNPILPSPLHLALLIQADTLHIDPALLVQLARQYNYRLLNLSIFPYLHNMHVNNPAFTSWTSLSFSSCTNCMSIQPTLIEPLCHALLAHAFQCNFRLLNLSILLYLYKIHFNPTFDSWTSLSCSASTEFMSIQPSPHELFWHSMHANATFVSWTSLACSTYTIYIYSKSNFCLLNHSVLLYLYK